MASNKAVIGLVDTTEQAEAIVTALRAAGFSTEDVSALFPDKEGTRDFAHEHHTKAPEGAVIGAGGGAVAGAAIGFLAGIGAVVIPGLGALLAAGPILATLAGVGAGAAVGGLTGALVGMGVPEVEAKLYEGRIRQGSILLAVHAEDQTSRRNAKRVLENGGARNITVIGEKGVDRSAPQARR